MMRWRYRGIGGALLAVALLLGTLPMAAQRKARAPRERADVARFRARVEAILTDAKAARGHWGVLIVDAATGEILFAHNPDSYFAPASNAKLFTTAFALARLSPEYRFRTTIETRGQVDSYGRLQGDLILVGRGDPNVSGRKLPFDNAVETDGPPEKILAALADRVAAAGVRQVEGDVVADDSFFPHERYPSGWAIDDMLWRYGAPVTALAPHDNVVQLELRPGARAGERAWYGLEPWTGFYEVRNEVVTGATGSKEELRVHREPGSRVILVGGSLPLDKSSHTLNIAVEEPAEHAAALLKRLLEARGVRVYGRARAQHFETRGRTVTVDGAGAPGGGKPEGEGVTVLAEHVSLPLIEAVTVINKISQNLHTEMLLRVAAREPAGAGDSEAALKAAKEFFQSIGIAEHEVVLHDGSGLSRRNLVTPRAVVTLLRWVGQQPWADAYRASLPVAASDGTLEERMKGTPAAGRIRAKTGTLDNVNALSGYAETVHGTKLVFSLFGNLHHLRGTNATGVLDAIAVAMVEELGAPGKKMKR